MGGRCPDLFAEGGIRGSSQQIDGIVSGDLINKRDPLILWVLFGKPDRGGRYGGIGRPFLFPYPFDILRWRVEPGPGPQGVCQIPDQFLVAVALASPRPARPRGACPIGGPFCTKS